MRVLLTGGAGYIGSHTAVVLAEHGHDVVVIDDYSNSHPEAMRRVAELSGKKMRVIEADLAQEKAASVAFAAALTDGSIDAVIHCAGLKAVGESVAQPTRYYRTNINSTLNVLDQMRVYGINRFVFSSSATVYGNPERNPINETHQVGVGLTNPYGWSKAMIEQIVRDVASAQQDFAGVLLRYFNPVGAHKSGRIGEDPSGIPNNLMPFVAQVAVGKREKLAVFGDNYTTPDGTGVRDYIHVTDLAEGHVAALEAAQPGITTYNLGSGIGASVLEVVAAFEAASGQSVPYQIVAPRPGDIAACVADPQKANRELGWATKRSLADACRDSWRWQAQNPNGYMVDSEVVS